MRKRFMHIGAMEKVKGKWKFLQNEDIDIDDFAEVVALKAAERISWISFFDTRQATIKHAIISEINEIIRKDSVVKTTKKSR